MAEVYEVEDRLSGERFALKLLAQVGSSALPRFNREYEALTRLNHPNIVRVFQYGLHESAPWLTMELLVGTPMQTRVKNVGKPGDTDRTAEVVRVVGYVAEALQYIHDRGLVHRDLKSDNVIVLSDGRVKLLDFGTARIADAMEPITKDGEFVGTFAYAAPEQITGAPVDHRADLYALGVLLYRMCTGQRPFDANDPAELARLHAKTVPPRPREKFPDLPVELDNLIMQLLSKRPDQRPANATAVALTLRQIGGVHLPPKLDLVATPDQAVGREAELREVVIELERAEPGTAILVEGGEGSGRVRFVRAVATEFEARGANAFAMTMSEERGLQQLVQLIIEAAEPLMTSGRPEARTAAEIVTRQSDAFFVTDNLRKRDALRKAAGMVLIERSRIDQQPVVLVLQQLHLAPTAALDLLVALRRDVYTAKANVRFLASCREESEEPDILVRQRFPDARRIRLAPLSVRGVALTVGTMLQRRPPPSDLARAVHVASGGHPAFVEEVVRQLVDHQALEGRGMDGNRIEWTKRDPLPLAPSARTTVDRALRRLPRLARRVLEGLAITGEDLTEIVLSRALTADLAELSPVLDNLVADGWITREEGTLRWARRSGRDVVIGDLSEARRSAWHRTLLAAFVDQPPSPGKVRVLLDADDVPQAAAVAVACTDLLLEQGRTAIAAEQLDEVVKRLGSNAENPERFVDVWLSHARCLMLVRPADAVVARSLARASEVIADDYSRKARLSFLRARMQSVIGHYPNYRKHLHEAWESVAKTEDHRMASTIACFLAQAYRWVGQPKTSEEWVYRGREAAKKSQNAASVAYADATAAPIRHAHGAIVEAERLAAGAMDRFKTIDHQRGAWSALAAWANALREQGRFSEALGALARALPAVREGDSPSLYVALLLVNARCEIDLYRLGKAQEVVDELEATIRSGEHLFLRLETKLLRGRISLASGQYADAAAAFADVYTRARPAELIGIAEIARALLGEAKWALGDKEAALDAFRNATLGLMGTGEQTALAEARATWARTVSDKEDPDTLFKPVAALLESEPLHLVRMELLLARARRLTAQKDTTRAFHAWRDAATLLNKIAGGLDEIDRAALRVHPWSRAVRRGLRT